MKKGFHKTDIIFLFLFCCVALFSWWLAPYGWTGSDEAYYILQPFRFTQGDKFFVDDWNNGQLFSLVILPLMHLHLKLAPSTDGIILSFRYYYVIVSALVSLVNLSPRTPCVQTGCTFRRPYAHALLSIKCQEFFI